MPNKKIAIKTELLEEMKVLCENNTDLLLVSLATTDGFSIKVFVSKTLNAEADQFAAMSSTISSLSDSSAKQVLMDKFDITIVESKSGNILFVRTSYLGIPCVLTIAARTGMPLATARFKTKGLAQNISEITE